MITHTPETVLQEQARSRESQDTVQLHVTVYFRYLFACIKVAKRQNVACKFNLPNELIKRLPDFLI